MTTNDVKSMEVTLNLHNGEQIVARPVNVLANKALAVYESKKIANEMSFNEKLDEQIKNEDGILRGFKR